MNLCAQLTQESPALNLNKEDQLDLHEEAQASMIQHVTDIKGMLRSYNPNVAQVPSPPFPPNPAAACPLPPSLLVEPRDHPLPTPSPLW